MSVFYWIDDNPERLADAQNMEAELQLSVPFFSVKDLNLDEFFVNLINANATPSLIILDQNLENANRGIFVKGSTVAAFIRESWPTCPIICITGEDVYRFNNQQKLLYEDVFPISQVSDFYDRIRSISTGFERINANWPENAKDITKLLGAPDVDLEKIITVLPTNLKEALTNKGAIVEISRWVREILMKRPGFLLDKLWLCTLIGINVKSFDKVADMFRRAKYEGLFASESQQRWWKSLVLEILYEITDLPGLPWEKGRGIPGLEEGDYSICYVSNEMFPETVAFTDQSSDTTEEPMKRKYTEIHPDFEKLLYFDDIRLMKAD